MRLSSISGVRVIATLALIVLTIVSTIVVVNHSWLIEEMGSIPFLVVLTLWFGAVVWVFLDKPTRPKVFTALVLGLTAIFIGSVVEKVSWGALVLVGWLAVAAAIVVVLVMGPDPSIRRRPRSSASSPAPPIIAAVPTGDEGAAA